MTTLILLSDFGRGGSFLAHGLIAQHPKIVSSETFVEDPHLLFKLTDLSPRTIQDLCKEGTSKRASIWLQDGKTNIIDIQNHTLCSCSKKFTSQSAYLIHIHSMLTFGKKFNQNLYEFINTNKINLKIVLTYRNFHESLTSWLRIHGKWSIRRHILFLFYYLRLKQNEKNFYSLEEKFQIFNFALENFYEDPKKYFLKLQNFLETPRFDLPPNINLRNKVYMGVPINNQNFNIYNMQYRVAQLRKIDLSKLEKMLLNHFQYLSAKVKLIKLIILFELLLSLLIITPIVIILSLFQILFGPLYLIVKHKLAFPVDQNQLGKIKDEWKNSFVFTDLFSLIKSTIFIHKWL